MVRRTYALGAKAALWAEFLALFVAAPAMIAVALPPQRMFSALFGFTLLGLFLLWRTGRFEWRSLLKGWPKPIEITGFALVVGVASGAILALTEPAALFGIIRQNPLFMVMIWALYPILSALPQELIFRALFFHRFGALFRNQHWAIIANAAIFSFAHLMYWSGIVAVLTFLGGWVFARVYVTRGFGAALILHAVAGNMLFLVGMGVFFYSGNVTRPF